MSSRPWLIVLLYSAVSIVIFIVWYISLQKSAHQISNKTGSQEKTFSDASVLNSGWDKQAFALFRKTFKWLNDQKPNRTVAFPIGGLTAQVLDAESDFWKLVEKGDWKRDSYVTFMQYINSDTIVVDVGAWIGPTVLFHGQLAARTYAIEADPVAFARMSYNLMQNVEKPWYNRVHLQAGCVGVDSKPLYMRSIEPGNGMSSFHKIFQEKQDTITVNWTVNCHNLSDLFKAWQIDSETAHVFIKITIESYECQLLPSLYSWLANMKRKPTLYVAMHEQIADCTTDQHAKIAELASLYRFHNNYIGGRGNVEATDDYLLSDLIQPA